LFPVESGGVESGRSIVMHEFPKRDVPYAEDMGKRAIEVSVRGYIIQYPQETTIPLYKRDYTEARDQLRERLDQGGAASLQLPMIAPLVVTCSRYRLTEEERYGGYCVFDMSFVEQGVAPFIPAVDPTEALIQKSKELRSNILDQIKMARVSAKPLSRSRQLSSGGSFPVG
jgi:prophage DNA circulation protein